MLPLPAASSNVQCQKNVLKSVVVCCSAVVVVVIMVVVVVVVDGAAVCLKPAVQSILVLVVETTVNIFILCCKRCGDLNRMAKTRPLAM